MGHEQISLIGSCSWLVFGRFARFPDSQHCRLDTHGHQAGGNHLAHGPEGVDIERPPLEAKGSHDSDHSHLSPKNDNSGLAQIIGVFILEFGVVLHRFIYTDFLHCSLLTKM